MLYNIVFNGASCKNVFHRSYKSDFHAVTAAYRTLQDQPPRPRYGRDMATYAAVSRVTDDGLSVDHIGIIELGGALSIERTENV